MSELLQEILKLKQDSTFVRNLTVTTTVALVFFLSLAETYHSPTRVAKQVKLNQFSHTVSAGMVIKTYKIFYR